jgi:FkbM family methyltransferase
MPETVRVRMPALNGRPSQSFRMHTRGGADQIARDLHRHGWHGFERPVPDVFSRCVSVSEGLVVDVGANTGFYSLAATQSSATVAVHAFEPYPVATACLRENLRLNRGTGDRVTVVEQAVSDQEGEAVLYVPDPSHGLVETSCSLNGEFKERVVDELRVPVVTLDAHLGALGWPNVGVVKIDVESLEHRVLAGARRLLTEARPLVFLEVLPSGDPEALERIRRAHDYVAVRLRPKSYILAPGVAYDDQGWNQALVPSERIGTFVDVLADVPLHAVPAGPQA